MSGDSFEPRCTLRDLGYHFNDLGQLRTITGDDPFKFTTQAAYEQLGDAMTHEIYDLLMKIGLQRLVLKKPEDTKEDHEYSFLFASPDFEDKDVLLVLVHGSGAVRAGQWGRKLILNESLDQGSQIPYIERAMSKGWGVLVLNTNNNTHMIDGQVIPLKYSKDSHMHARNAWWRFVRFARARTIHIVAHSRGGMDVSHVMKSFTGEDRVDVICLTDSSFSFCHDRTSQPIVINWAAQPYSFLTKPTFGDRRAAMNIVHQLWAGTKEHDRSSYAAMESVFHILEHRPNKMNIGRLLVEAWSILEPRELLKEDELEDEEEVYEEGIVHFQEDGEGDAQAVIVTEVVDTSFPVNAEQLLAPDSEVSHLVEVEGEEELIPEDQSDEEPSEKRARRQLDEDDDEPTDTD